MEPVNELKEVKKQFPSILGGWSSIFYGGKEDQYLDSVGIDPEIINELDGFYNVFGTIIPNWIRTDITSPSLAGNAPMWITAAPTTQGAYVYGSGGTLYTIGLLWRIDEEGGIINTGGEGNGLVERMDYLYLATGTDIVRFGTLSATGPTAILNYWTSSANGLGQAALTDTDYPLLLAGASINFPNHPMHLHNDGYVYVGDYASGVGQIHSFYVSSAGATTVYFADLLLPPGYYPFDIKSYGTDLAIVASRISNVTGSGLVRFSDSALFLWDTISKNFYRQVPIPFELATALANKNGELYVLCGNYGGNVNSGGVNLLKYLGGMSFDTIASRPESRTPSAGAVDVYGNMIAFGGSYSFGGTSTTAAGAMAVGYRNAELPSRAFNFIQRATVTTRPYQLVSALKFMKERGINPVLGWSTGSDGDGDWQIGIDAYLMKQQNSMFRYLPVNVGKPFTLRRITLPLTGTVSAETEITPVVWIDNGAKLHELKTINSTNYPNADLLIEYGGLQIPGKLNFILQLKFTSSIIRGIAPGASYELDYDD